VIVTGAVRAENVCARYGVTVVGTHPIPAKYLDMHTRLGTWQDPAWESLLAPTMADEATRKAYN
jgi:hypothetical protein